MSELRKADAEALLMAEAFALGQHNPAIWNHYVSKWEADVIARINERFTASSPADWGTGGGAEPSLGNPAAGDDGSHAPATG